jgi:hypothetical protein
LRSTVVADVGSTPADNAIEKGVRGNVTAVVDRKLERTFDRQLTSNREVIVTPALDQVAGSNGQYLVQGE